MSNPDEKVQKQIDKAVASALKTEKNRVKAVITAATDDAKNIPDKAVRTAVTAAIKAVKDGVNAPSVAAA